MTRRGLSVLVLLILTACGPGPYPVDVMPEMHYSPAQRRGEPTRLSPSSDAVPVRGGRPRVTYAEAAALVDPSPGSPDRLVRGAEVYRVNCAICHGADGRGRSVTADAFRAAAALPPTDLSSARVQQRTPGQTYWLVANGIGNMPPFGGLLSDDELWQVVGYIRTLAPQ